MNIIKRDGSEAVFCKDKIIAAIHGACADVDQSDRVSENMILKIADSIEEKCASLGYAVSVEDIQDMVENGLLAHDAYALAKAYIRYRQTRANYRDEDTLVKKIMTIVDCKSEEANQENSNKNPVIASTQRDYVAGEASRYITDRVLLPDDIRSAHEQGIIHFHDSDYFIQHMFNCCLLNLEDMLQNGTVISGTLIERPHSFSTACNIATQIIAQVASNQYGGQSISLAHLAPFVDVSRQKIKQEVDYELNRAHGTFDVDYGEIRDAIVERRLRSEVKRGVQTIQYQVVTRMTTNGQAPFITVYMNLGEAKSEREKKDLALIIEEVLTQRIEGVKNESGVWITPAFPKLIYVLDEDNVTEDAPYFYLTKLSAKCTAKRMVPDYISAKVMRKLKGDVYTCMGCRSFLTPDRFTGAGIGNIANAGNYEPGKHKYYGRLIIAIGVSLNLVNA